MTKLFFSYIFRNREIIFLLPNRTGAMARPSSLVLCTGTAVVIGAWLFLKKTSKKRVPYAPAGVLETLNAITGPTAPWFLLDMFQKVKKTGRLSFRIALPVPGKEIYVTGDFNLAREVLKDFTTDKGRDRSFSIIGGKANIFTSQNNAHWRFVRKATVPAFSASEVGRMNDIAVQHIDNWFQSVLEPSIKEGKSFDANKEMCKLTFQVICEAAFEYIPSAEEFEKFEHHLQIALVQFIFKYTMNPLRKIFASYIPEVQEGFASCREVQKFAGRLLDAYRKNPNKSANNTLIKLIAGNDSFDSDAQRISEIVVYLIAGHDTTGISLSTAMVLLTKHPQYAKKLREELAKSKSPADCEYLKFVLKESSRILPTAALGSIRVAGRDFDAGNGEIIPKGATVFMPQIAPNRNEDVFEDPEIFNPDRWINATPEMKNSMLTFSLGIRNCVGQALATAELDSILPRIVSQYDFEIEEEGSLQFFLTLRHVGTKLRAKPLKIIA